MAKQQSISNLDALAERLLSAQRVAVLTGAGVSKESGIKTFREADGLWAKFRPEELANVNAFLSNPKLVWDWYNMRRNIVNESSPNPGHYALVEMEKMLPHFVVITQNVDSLHFTAGSTDVIELHGNIQRNKCHSCGRYVEQSDVVFDEGELPHCECGGMIRPDVVWFGEQLPQDAIQRAWNEAQASDVFFSIGTSTVVFPAAQLPYEAKRSGAYVVEINPNPTGFTLEANLAIQEPSGEALPKIVEAMKRKM